MIESLSLEAEARILVLTRDLTLIRDQLYSGLQIRLEDIGTDDLLDDVNTDLITPVWTCFDHRPEDIARNAYAGLMLEGERLFEQDALIQGNFSVIVSGQRKGTGSSRETAVQAERWAGVRIVAAESFAPIYERNCINLGQITCDLTTLQRLVDGETIVLDELTQGHDAITRLVIAHGGLLPFVRAVKQGEIGLPGVATGPRPMTLAEKIYALKALNTEPKGACVAPGDSLVCEIDGGYSYEFTTPQVDDFLSEEFGPDYEIRNADKFAVFEDHMIFDDRVPRFAPFLEKIQGMRALQRAFRRRTGVRDYSAENGVSPGICHQVAREAFIDPGDFFLATDSHTCMGGGNNALAFGVGATEYAAVIWSGLAPVTVPETIRFELVGTLDPGCTAKDVMLFILKEYARTNATLNRAMEFGGPGLGSLSPDERATLCNMATECSARTAVAEGDRRLVDWIAEQRPGADTGHLADRLVRPDPGASYGGGVHTIDLGAMRPMLAHPGAPERGIPSDPTNGMSVADADHIPIDIAYGGSCTAGKIDDLSFYADVCATAIAAGRKVPDGVSFFIQFGSKAVEQYARRMDWIELFERTGVTLLAPGCGACIGCGPGASQHADQVTISAINRNYQGRSGPGKLYLASPLTVAASAFAGRIVAYKGEATFGD